MSTRRSRSDTPHLIGETSYSGGWSTCTVCGVTVEQGDFLTLESAWDHHRGAQVRPSVYRAAQLASNYEVRKFLSDITGSAVDYQHQQGVAAKDLIDVQWLPFVEDWAT